MSSLKWIIGLCCLLYPTRLEGALLASREMQTGKMPSKDRGHADQKTCDTIQALIHGHAT